MNQNKYLQMHKYKFATKMTNIQNTQIHKHKNTKYTKLVCEHMSYGWDGKDYWDTQHI